MIKSALSALGLLAWSIAGADLPSELPRLEPVPPGEALKTFQIKEGFRLELAASEPLVQDPIAMAFDEDGRLFAVEMRGYSERREDNMGRVRLLEDTNNDGHFDRSSVYVDGLAWPTGVFCYGGGVFVAVSPDIFYFKDTTGDGRADVRQLVFTGFGVDAARLNVQQLPNSLSWGLDNRIHVALGGNPSRVSSLQRPDLPPLELRGRDFSFDPVTFEMRAESGGGQYGLSFDDAGRKFVCSNSRHLQWIAYEQRYSGRNRYFPLPPPAVDIPEDGPAAEVFRISPDEPWRVVRTRWRVQGVATGPIEGGGRVSGYFTAATGNVVYRGSAWPEDYRGDAFIADCGSNLIHRKKVFPKGSGWSARRPEDEQQTEFLASTDNWFRPVQLLNGPDGCLYIADMYREVIEHPWSLPEPIKKHLDLNSGNDRGRIYRIAPDNFQRPEIPRLSEMESLELVKLLEHPDAWRRESAARLLFERRDSAVAPALERLLVESKSKWGRLSALHALQGLNALEMEHVLQAFQDADPVVRKHACQLSERWAGEPDLRPLLRKRWETLADDSSIEVRAQLAWSLSLFDFPGKTGVLRKLAERDAGDYWMRMAILNAAHAEPAELLVQLFESANENRQPLLLPLAEQLGGIIGKRATALADSGEEGNQSAAEKVGELEAALSFLIEEVPWESSLPVIAAAVDGLKPRRTFFAAALNPRLIEKLLERAEETAFASGLADGFRQMAVAVLLVLGDGRIEQKLLGLIEKNEAPEVQLAVLRNLGESHLAAVQTLVERWSSIPLDLREPAWSWLLGHPQRAGRLLEALQQGSLPSETLSSSQRRALLHHSNAAIRTAARDLLGESPPAPRQEVLQNYLPSLLLTGERKRGEAIYQERCASCHRYAGAGERIGPDLETASGGGKEKLLLSIIDPHREVAPEFVVYEAATRDGELHSGLLASDSETHLVLRSAQGDETVLAKAEVLTVRQTARSLMPEGLEEGLSLEEMAALLDFLTQ